MLHKALLLAAVLSVFVSSSAMASTVTLKGSCPTQSYLLNQTNHYIPFNITNLGNGTATNLLILPVLQGASTPNATITIPIVAPGSTYTERIYASNYTVPGTYVEYFVSRYSQDADTFVTIFPCIVSIGQRTQSLISILNISSTSTRLGVSMANIGTSPITATVVAQGPPTFTIAEPVRNVTIGAYTHTGISFNLSSPSYTNSDFPVAVSASYVSNGLHYSTLGVTTIAFGASPGSTTNSSSGPSILEIAVIAIVAVLIALITFSVVRKRASGGKDGSHHSEERKAHEHEHKQ